MTDQQPETVKVARQTRKKMSILDGWKIIYVEHRLTSICSYHSSPFGQCVFGSINYVARINFKLVYRHIFECECHGLCVSMSNIYNVQCSQCVRVYKEYSIQDLCTQLLITLAVDKCSGRSNTNTHTHMRMRKVIAEWCMLGKVHGTLQFKRCKPN